MPSVEFVLPHWLYWAGLVAFPLIAMALSRRERPEPGVRNRNLAYFLLLVGGFLGLHRLYLGKWITALIWFFTAGLFLLGYLYDYWTLNDQIDEVNREERRRYARG